MPWICFIPSNCFN